MLKKILFFIFTTLLFTKSFANDLDFIDEWKTIRELKENIENLDKNKIDLDLKIDSFATELYLIDYLKENLTYADFENLKNIISDYNKDRYRLEKIFNDKSINLKDTKKTKIKLLEVKKELYKNMTPYIKQENYSDYLEYIKSDTSLYSEQKELDSDILRKQEILNNKVETLEKRIVRHKEYIENNLILLVEKKIEEKIFNLNENKDFLALNNDNKINILNKTILKIESRITELKEIEYIDSVNLYLISSNEKKIEIYNIALEKLEVFMKEYK